jgi:malto-oligosyltrehalose synthase
MDEVNALLHDASGEVALRQQWGAISGRPTDFVEEETAARREVLTRAFTAQLDAVVGSLHRIALARVETRDITHAAIRRALVAVLTHFPVYRSYGVGRRSRSLANAVARAMKDVPTADRAMLVLVESWLGEEATPETAIRFQQLSAPLAAKAVEDTAYYRHGALLSRNEVGADVRRFSATTAEFHAACLARREHFPDAMLATATHDHKRGEDVRARLAVLSEIPLEWEHAVRRWFEMNSSHRRIGETPMPSPADEAMLYQIIVGAWPTDAVELPDYTERLAGWQLKALREAKLATDWTAPDLEYEDAARSFLYTIMADDGFIAEASTFAQRIGPAGAVNGLTQTLLKLTVPGVPDIYQGAEFWDQSMVDPDNRRPVEFARRIAALAAREPPVALTAYWQDGRVKQAVIRRTLDLRQERPELFARGEYRPLEVTGPLAPHVVAFARSGTDVRSITVVPRLPGRLLGLVDTTPLQQARVARPLMIPADVWRETMLHLPEDLVGQPMRDWISERYLGRLCCRLPLAKILARFPVALLATE